MYDPAFGLVTGICTILTFSFQIVSVYIQNYLLVTCNEFQYTTCEYVTWHDVFLASVEQINI
jgi:hypothetical protein